MEKPQKELFIKGNDFSTKFLVQSSGDKFLFNELIEDDFYVLSATHSFFNIRVLESFDAYSFSRSLLCEKENSDLPALIVSCVRDDEYWFIVK